jgi:hypothetical protein
MNGRRGRWNGIESARYGIARAPGILDPNTGKPGEDDPFYQGVLNNELADKGFLVTRPTKPDQLGAHRLADVDDLRSGLLRGRDDAGLDAALRPRAFRLRAARQPAPVRRHDRRRHADQQNGARRCARSTTRCPSRAT